MTEIMRSVTKHYSGLAYWLERRTEDGKWRAVFSLDNDGLAAEFTRWVVYRNAALNLARAWARKTVKA